MGAQSAYNAKLHETFLALSNEWQAFVGQRVKEDMHVLQRIAGAKSPEQVWTVCSKFWQKAAEDYAREYSVIIKLTGNCVISSASAAEEALHASAEAAPTSDRKLT
ncbi:MAG: hypothetical protein HC869_13270 [Rhodospirillales bacterium]|nr:hypothetical protein [Rhodospirillales bacterium]